VIDFVIFCTYPLPSPFLPGVLEKRGVDATMTGIIFSIMTASMFVLSPFVSYPSRWFGRKAVFTAGLLIEAAGIVGFGFIDRLEGNTLIGVAVTLRIISGAGAAICETLSVSYLVDATPPGKLSKWFGLLEIFPGLGLMAGPPLGGFIFEYVGFLPTFLVNAGMLLVPVVLGVLWLPSDAEEGDDEEEDPIPLTKMLSYKWVWLGMLGSMLPCVSWGLLDTTLEFHLSPYKLTPSQVGLMFLIPAVTYLILSPPAGYICDWVGGKATSLAGLLFLVLGLLFLGPAPFFMMPSFFWVDSVSLLMIGVGSALATVPSLEIMVEAVEELGDNVNDEVSGLISSAIALGNTIGPFMGSTLTEATSFGWCVSIVAGINGIVVLIYFVCCMSECVDFSKGRRRGKRSSTVLLSEMEQ